MKKNIILLLFLVAVSTLFAKDISIKVVNGNDFPITIFCGAISNKQNAYIDDEMVQYRKDLLITATGRPLAPGKKLQIDKKDLSGSNIIVVFGMSAGGGRTTIFRYRVKDLDKLLDITFDKIKIYKPNSSYNNIAEALKTTENLGSIIINTKNQVPGRFVYYNISSDTLGEVYVADRTIDVDIETTEKNDNSVSDLISKTAVPPFINNKGDIVRAIPPNTTETYTEVVIPGIDKSTDIFNSNFKFLTWNIVGSRSINVKYKGNDYFRLYSTSNEADRTLIMKKYLKDLNDNGSSAYHLYFITSVHKTDTLTIIDENIRKIEEYEQLEENDLITPNGNFRLDGTSKTILQATNVINDVKAIDITPLLGYRAIVQGKFSNTLASAQNCVDVYKYIGGFVELPDLDDKTLSISVSPAYTLSKIKEVMSDPKILANIELKLISQTPFAISINAMKAAQVKIDMKAK